MDARQEGKHRVTANENGSGKHRVAGLPGPPIRLASRAVSQLRALAFRGRAVYCPCCGKRFRHFLYSPYLTSRCPYCLSVERYRVLCRFLDERLSFGSRPVRLLDIAPMRCFQVFCRRKGGVEYVSADIASPLAMYQMDINNLGFDDESFDCLVCFHVLEHVEDDSIASAELYRVLRKGGWAIIQVPIEADRTLEKSGIPPEDRQGLLRWESHLRLYGPDFADRLRSAGFDVEVIPYARGLDPAMIAREGLDGNEDIYLCRRPPADPGNRPARKPDQGTERRAGENCN